MQPAIRVENLSKRYQLGLTHAGSVRELVNGAVAKVFGRGGQSTVHSSVASDPDVDHIWALRDVSFEVNPGEAIGIIGRNGAGKSTLLKLLSRITRPSGGRVELHGRVASLLEVGTGFHPELTGRENVYMNGTILGMTKNEIKAEFDSIVDFAEVEKFIDTPVKRYSSGMTVRLGFAVAAHLNPEIMIVDEVLAVGDAEFQKRCLGKMDDVAKSGRTVLFVSHNMSSIRQLAPRSILIDQGRLVFDGDTETTLDQYLGRSATTASDSKAEVTMNRADWGGERSLEFIEVGFAKDPNQFPNEPIGILLKLRANTESGAMRIGTTIFLADGMPVASSFSGTLPSINVGTERTFVLRIEAPCLAPGRYWFTVGLLNARNQVTDVIQEVLHFEIPHSHNVPTEFVQWDSRWGPLRLEATLSRVG